MISNKGFNEGIITLYIDENATVGAPVKMSDSNVCATAADGDEFIGVLVNARGTLGGVQVSGYAQLPYSGADPELGITKVAADGNGGIKQVEDGRAITVIGVNTDASTVEILM